MKSTLAVVVVGTMLAMANQPAFAAEQASPATKSDAAAPNVTKVTDTGTAPIVVEMTKTTAKVLALDAAKRTITFKIKGKSRSGVKNKTKIKTITCGPEVKNFDQIKVGDLLKFSFVESFAVSILKTGAPPSKSETNTVTLAPKGAKPGALVTETLVLQAKIEAVDMKKGTLTVTTPAGETKTFKMSKEIKELKDLQKGNDIVVKVTVDLVVVIETPAPKK